MRIEHCDLRYTCKHAFSDKCDECCYGYGSEYEEDLEDD